MQYKQYEKSMLIYRGRKKNNINSSKKEQNFENKTQNLKNIHKTLVETSKKENYAQPQRNFQMGYKPSILEKYQNQKIVETKKKHNNRSLYQLTSFEKDKQLSNNKSKKNIIFDRYNQKTQQKITNLNSHKSRHNLSVQSLVEQRNNKHRYSEQKSIKQKQKSVNFYINIEKLKNLKITSRNSKLQNSFNFPQPIYLNKKSTHNLSIDKRSLNLKNMDKNKISSYENIQSSINGRFITKKKNPSIKPKIRYRTHQNQIQQQLVYLNNPSRSHASQYLIPKKSNFRKHQLSDKSFIEGYLKGKQLGRGGFSRVWQAFHFSTKQFYAVKQIETTNKYQTHLTQIWFGNYFFEFNGKIKAQYQKHPGIQRLLKMYEYSIVDPKAFIVYETCDGSLGNMLYDIYEEDLPNEEQIDDDQKMYMIKYKHLYGQLRKSPDILKNFIKEIAQALDLLTKNRIVHSDIKTQNILLKKTQNHKKYDFKLIDYGSSFLFQSLKQYKLATPQYMCPELLNYILFQNKKSHHQYMLQYVKLYQNISAIDVWGLGCIVIQLIHGLPLWLNNPTKILIKGCYQTKKGLFAVSDRSFSQILQKQLSIVNNFDDFIRNENNSGIIIDQQIKEITKQMLNPNPRNRIRPYEIIQALQR